MLPCRGDTNPPNTVTLCKVKETLLLLLVRNMPCIAVPEKTAATLNRLLMGSMRRFMKAANAGSNVKSDF